MDYADVVAASFVPSPEGLVARPTQAASIARQLRDAIEPVAMHGVWSELTNTRLGELGLNFGSGYVWGRAAALGEPAPGVVVSSFAVFAPEMIVPLYEDGRATASRADLLAARTAATTESLSAVLAGHDVGPVADALQTAVSGAEATGRPLFAGLVGEPWPDADVGRLWHACELAREHRGDGHVAVCVAEGLQPIEMNVLTELWVGYPLGTYSASRGWSAEAIAEAVEGLRADGLVDGDELSEEGLVFRTEIEEATDLLDQSIVDALGEDADAVIGWMASWSELCVAAKAFPPDVLKRAAG